MTRSIVYTVGVIVRTMMMMFAVCLCRSSAMARFRFRPISIACLLLLFLLFGLTAASSDTVNSFRKMKMKKDVSLLPTNGALTGSFVTKSSHNGSDSDSDDDDDSDEDDDDDDDDVEDENERIQNAIVGAVPAVLGLLAIIILCIFMLCGRNRTGRNERPKWTSRSERRPSSSSYNSRPNQNRNNPAEVGLSMDVDNDDDWSHVYHHRTQPPAAVHSPVPSYEACVGLHTASVDDLPPSYEEVMQGAAGHVRSIPPTT